MNMNSKHLKPYPLAATATEIKATGLSGIDQQPVEEVEILDSPDSSKVIASEKVNDPLDNLGTNNWLESGQFPDINDAPYAIRPFGSWYLALNSINSTG